jgi:hypothetical protein
MTGAAGECESLREMARKCRCLARGASTTEVSETLSEMARDYDRKADTAAAAGVPAPEAPGG